MIVFITITQNAEYEFPPVFITDHDNPSSNPSLTESFSQLFGNSSAGHGVTLEYY